MCGLLLRNTISNSFLLERYLNFYNGISNSYVELPAPGAFEFFSAIWSISGGEQSALRSAPSLGSLGRRRWSGWYEPILFWILKESFNRKIKRCLSWRSSSSTLLLGAAGGEGLSGFLLSCICGLGAPMCGLVCVHTSYWSGRRCIAPPSHACCANVYTLPLTIGSCVLWFISHCFL